MAQNKSLNESIREAASQGYRVDQIAGGFQIPEEQVRHVLQGGNLETGTTTAPTGGPVVVQKMMAGGPEVLAVLSATPKAGKTFTSIHLAYALALKGVRVAVMDADTAHTGLSLLLPSTERIPGAMALNGSGLSWGKLAFTQFAAANGSVSIVPMHTVHPGDWTDLPGLFTKVVQVARGEVDYLVVDAGREATQLQADALAAATEVLLVLPVDASVEMEMRRGLDRMVSELAYHEVWAVLNRYPPGYSARQGSPVDLCREIGVTSARTVKVPDYPAANLFLQKNSRAILADHRVADNPDFRAAFEGLLPSSVGVPRKKKRLFFGRGG